MAFEGFYLVEIESGKTLERWSTKGMSKDDRADLGRKLQAELQPDDPERGIDLRDTFTDKRAPWE